MPPSHRPKRAACSGGLSSTTRPSTPEIGVLKGQCLDRRIESRDRLVAEIDAWQVQRNQNGARIAWMFSTDKARTKMARAYPDPSLKES